MPDLKAPGYAMWSFGAVRASGPVVASLLDADSAYVDFDATAPGYARVGVKRLGAGTSGGLKLRTLNAGAAVDALTIAANGVATFIGQTTSPFFVATAGTGVVPPNTTIIDQSTPGVARILSVGPSAAVKGSINLVVSDTTPNVLTVLSIGPTGAVSIPGLVSLGGIQLSAGAGTGAGSVYKHANDGLVLWAVGGAFSDLTLYSPAAAKILTVPTGTVNVSFNGGISAPSVSVNSAGNSLGINSIANVTAYLNVSINTAGTPVATVLGSDATSGGAGFMGTLSNHPLGIRSNNTTYVTLGSGLAQFFSTVAMASTLVVTGGVTLMAGLTLSGFGTGGGVVGALGVNSGGAGWRMLVVPN